MEIHCDEAALKGITGKGVGFGVLDTGIYLHEELKGKIQGFKDFVHGKKLPYDDNGHGTLKRIPKDSFYWYKKVIESNGSDLNN